MIHIPLDHYATGVSPMRPGVGVELDNDGGFNVVLFFDDQSDRDNDGTSRTLRPEEARALAAMLRHYADEAGIRP